MNRDGVGREHQKETSVRRGLKDIFAFHQGVDSSHCSFLHCLFAFCLPVVPELYGCMLCGWVAGSAPCKGLSFAQGWHPKIAAGSSDTRSHHSLPSGAGTQSVSTVASISCRSFLQSAFCCLAVPFKLFQLHRPYYLRP